MKKAIRKPVNWQDFESLCKILWGEIWGISDKIKKNGRLGQPQSGVDVYGVPKGRINYSGIQCKGKDDYTTAKLTEKEIDEEIEKAKIFTPALETFIFATSANKDITIEEYVRRKDLESRKNNGFEILLFCWEDIADLIEVNRQTFNYYVLENQFKSNFDIEVCFSNGNDTLIIRPKFKKIITRYALNPNLQYTSIPPEFIEISGFNHIHTGWMAKPNINNSWASLIINFKNSGSVVLEDFKLYIHPEKNKFRNLVGFRGGIVDKFSYLKNSPLYVFEEEPKSERYAVYRQKDNAPLIQKDSKSFELYILVNHESYEMKIYYELLARDFNQEGFLTLRIEPEFEVEKKTVWVNTKDEIMNDEIKIEDILVVGPLL